MKTKWIVTGGVNVFQDRAKIKPDDYEIPPPFKYNIFNFMDDVLDDVIDKLISLWRVFKQQI